MNTDKRDKFLSLHSDITEKILSGYFTVYNELGYGFLEKVYVNSLEIELTDLNLNVLKQYPVDVYYKQRRVGEYYADLLVNNSVIVELKSVETLTKEHEAQLLNYLRATDYEVGLLINFGKKVEFKRKIFTNEKKKNNQCKSTTSV